MDDVNVFQNDGDLAELGLSGKELATFVQLLGRLINTNKEGGGSLAKPSQARLVEIADGLYRVRRRRELLMTESFGGDLFADPAWDILLDLYVQNSRSEDVSVTRACAAAVVPVTTALRYITVLADRGLIERTKNPDDGRSYLLRLTGRAVELMEEILAEMAPSPQPGQGESHVSALISRG